MHIYIRVHTPKSYIDIGLYILIHATYTTSPMHVNIHAYVYIHTYIHAYIHIRVRSNVKVK
jgi:hypothetical protein